MHHAPPSCPVYLCKEVEAMGRKDALLYGANRRNALAALSREERMKYEIAQELGLMDKVRSVGWAGLTAQETGRIGGLIGQRRRQNHS